MLAPYASFQAKVNVTGSPGGNVSFGWWNGPSFTTLGNAGVSGVSTQSSMNQSVATVASLQVGVLWSQGNESTAIVYLDDVYVVFHQTLLSSATFTAWVAAMQYNVVPDGDFEAHTIGNSAGWTGVNASVAVSNTWAGTGSQSLSIATASSLFGYFASAMSPTLANLGLATEMSVRDPSLSRVPGIH